MDPRTWEYLLRLGLSALLGGIIGLERETRLSGAGIRTHLIVTFASCMMMLVSKYGFFDMMAYESVKLDSGRIAAGMVTAVGFLGASTIFARKRGITLGSAAAGVLFIRIDDTSDALDQLLASLTVLGVDTGTAKYEREDGALSVELQLDRLPCPQGELGRYFASLMKAPYVRSLQY